MDISPNMLLLYSCSDHKLFYLETIWSVETAVSPFTAPSIDIDRLHSAAQDSSADLYANHGCSDLCW
jgi:hypothetical protein